MTAAAARESLAAAGGKLPGDVRLQPLGFAELDGWAFDDHAAALACLRRSAAVIAASDAPLRPGTAAGRGLRAIAVAALQAEAAADPRGFFERAFRPFRILAGESTGLLTGYYEPEVEGRRTPGGRFRTPLLARPDDLVGIDPAEAPAHLKGLAAARRLPDGRLTVYPDRAAIESGALDGKGLALVWLADPADAFFAQIQGSVRVRLEDGAVLRLAYAGRNGHPYTPIGRVMVERGLLPREAVTMQTIRAYLAAEPEAGRELMRQNRSYVFFAVDTGLGPADGPRGGQGVPLTPGRSLAVDRGIWPYGLPFWIEGHLPTGGGDEEPLARLMIAQDTGSAIVGAARGDYFAGSGAEAGTLAGLLKDRAVFTVLLPVLADRR